VHCVPDTGTHKACATATKTRARRVPGMSITACRYPKPHTPTILSTVIVCIVF
jgi:hypothetical protein